MAGDSRTLKLAILGEVRDLSASLNKGADDVSTFGDKITKFGKIAGAAFIAAGAAAAAYAGKLAIDGVKSAIEDEAAQLRLATSLRNVTGATDDQIKSTEDYITKAQLAYGINDNDLRPSLDRLVRSTKDVEEAQKLQTLAINIAAGTGKDLASVTEALAKAHDGNFGALKRVGISLDENIIKSKDFDAATGQLAKTFEGQANIQAETFQGKMKRLNEAFGEAKEKVGGFIIDAVTPLISAFMDRVVPSLDSVGTTLKDKLLPVFTIVAEFLKNLFKPILEGIKDAFDKVRDALGDNSEKFAKFFEVVKEVAGFVAKYLAPVIGTTLKVAFEIIGSVLSTVIDYFAGIIDVVTRAFNLIKSFVSFVANNSLVKGIAGAVSGLFGGGRASGGAVTAGTTYLVGEKGAELFTPSQSGYIVPNGAMGGSAPVYNITVNGAIDAEGTARSIIDIINRSAGRGTLGAGAFI